MKDSKTDSPLARERAGTPESAEGCEVTPLT